MFKKDNFFYLLLGILGVVALLKFTGILDRFTRTDAKSTLVNHVGVVNDTQEEDFIESKTFNGERKGYVFKTGDNGTGYYLD